MYITLDEIRSHLQLGRSNAICIDISVLPELLSNVGKVTMCKGNTVRIGCHTFGIDENNILFSKTYPMLEEMVQVMESYLGQPFSEWENLTKTGRYPARLEARVSVLDFVDYKQMMQTLVPEGFTW